MGEEGWMGEGRREGVEKRENGRDGGGGWMGEGKGAG